jgi:hypothetical protein
MIRPRSQRWKEWEQVEQKGRLEETVKLVMRFPHPNASVRYERRPSTRRVSPFLKFESDSFSTCTVLRLETQNEYFRENCMRRGVPLVCVISPMALVPLKFVASTFAFPVNWGF